MASNLSSRHSVRRVNFDRFATTTRDKDPPPYFAGREEVVSDIETACALSWESHVSGDSQQRAATRVVYGAPGAGKTSLLQHLCERWANDDFITLDVDGGVRNQPAPRMFYLQGGWLSITPHFILRNIVELVQPGASQQMYLSASQTGHSEAAISAGFIKGRIGSSNTEQHSAGDIVLETLARLLPPEKWQFPVVVGIDEAQNTVGDRDSPMGGLLQELHDNDYDLPVTVILGGLCDTVLRAGELGLTRISSKFIHSLDCFTKHEMDELKQGFCEHYGILLKGRDSEFDALLSATDGWPSHIANCLTSFAMVYRRCGRDMSEVDFEEVARHSMDARIDYYFGRLSSPMRGSGQLLAMLMREIGDGLREGQIKSSIRRLGDSGEKARIYEQELPKGMDADDYYLELIRQGALQERKDGIVSCPIPSFRDFIIKNYPIESPHHP